MIIYACTIHLPFENLKTRVRGLWIGGRTSSTSPDNILIGRTIACCDPHKIHCTVI